ncbi:hypothetical protein ACQKOF_07345 [Lysinibacillus sp. NPDC093190]|uniref:hypothetical protein n=1 Tax=Lysinibacillus sp. NPDC093190 TaxID=3390575 RepID=UPI003D06F57F
MKKMSVCLLLLLYFQINHVEAITTDLEKIYLEGGEYTEVNEAIQESEAFFKRNIPLPTRLPPIIFTHVFGSFNHKHPQLSIEYLVEDAGRTHYTIVITDSEYGRSYTKRAKKVKLPDGNEMVYFKSSDFVIFNIVKNDFHYIFIVDEVSADTITVDGMVKIINSMK